MVHHKKNKYKYSREGNEVGYLAAGAIAGD